jgi:hypothetical protein
MITAAAFEAILREKLPFAQALSPEIVGSRPGRPTWWRTSPGPIPFRRPSEGRVL